jgi:hypothetical protein
MYIHFFGGTLMQELKITALYSLENTIADNIFNNKTYPYEVLPEISSFILNLGPTLSSDKFNKIGDNVWVAKTATVAPSAFIGGPCIIDEYAEIRHCAFIRGNAIVGKNCVVGNSTELKNVILFDFVQVPHYNYVGDSVLGFRFCRSFFLYKTKYMISPRSKAVNNYYRLYKIEFVFIVCRLLYHAKSHAAISLLSDNGPAVFHIYYKAVRKGEITDGSV